MQWGLISHRLINKGEGAGGLISRRLFNKGEDAGWLISHRRFSTVGLFNLRISTVKHICGKLS